jgi:phage-related protein
MAETAGSIKYTIELDGAQKFAGDINTASKSFDDLESKGVKSLSKATDGASNSILGMAKSFAIGSLAAGGISTGIQAIGGFLRSSVSEFSASEKAASNLNAVVSQTNKAFGRGLDVKDIQNFATELQNATGIADDSIIQSSAVLASFGGVTKDNFKKAQEAAANLSTVMGSDLQGATLQLGKALENPEKGLTALARSGISFTDAQKEQILLLQSTGREAEAQQAIIEAVYNNTGDAARAAGKTTTGQLDILREKFNNIKEVIGGFVLEKIVLPGANLLLAIIGKIGDAFSVVKDAFLTVKDAFNRASTPVKVIIGLLVAFILPLYAIIAAAVVFKDKIINAFQKVVEKLTALKSLFDGGLLDGLKNIGGIIVDKIVEAFGSLKDRAIKAIGNLDDVGKQKGKEFVEGILSTLRDIPEKISTFFSSLPERIKAGFDQFIEKMKTEFERVKDGFTKGFDVDPAVILSKILAIGKIIVIGIAAIFVGLPLLIAGALLALAVIVGLFLLKIVAQVLAWAVQFIASIVGAFIGFVGTILSIGVQIIGAVTGFLATVIAIVIGFAANLVVSFVSAFNNVISAVENFVANFIASIVGFVGRIIGLFGDIVSGIRNNIDQMISTVREGISNIVDFFSSLPSRILGVLGNLGSTLVGAGRAIMDGLKQGIVDGFNKVKDYVSGIADTIKSLKGPLPKDKVLLEDEGFAIMFGLNKGIKTGFSMVKDTLSNITDTIANTNLSASGTISVNGGVGALSSSAFANPALSSVDNASTIATPNANNTVVKKIVVEPIIYDSLNILTQEQKRQIYKDLQLASDERDRSVLSL